jgi:hypothetical protein
MPGQPTKRGRTYPSGPLRRVQYATFQVFRVLRYAYLGELRMSFNHVVVSGTCLSVWLCQLDLLR